MAKNKSSTNISSLQRRNPIVRRLVEILKRLKQSETIIGILAIIVIVAVVTPMLAYYIVTSKQPLELTLETFIEVDKAYVIAHDEYGNSVATSDLRSINQELDALVIPKELVSLDPDTDADVNTTLSEFCSAISNNYDAIAVFGYDYILPLVTYDCSNKGMVVYGNEVESNYDQSISFIDELQLSLQFFF